jgi:beta-lactamase regulating signal transducer with metallopeptidase domain
MNLTGWHEIASVAFERMVYSLAEGTLLTFVVVLALRLLPARTSQTRFAIWFSALFGIVAVTLFGLHGASAMGGHPSQSLVTLPVSFALAAFAVWALLAVSGIARIALGLWQLHKLRQQCEPVNIDALPADVRELLQSFQGVRRVTLLQAPDFHPPKAVGFFCAAIIVPKWLLAEGTAGQIKHVLLHELAHLRRRDDWTNLLQQAVKALFFFHPAIWWMERELSLSREQACDDAVLEQTADAHDYARSLALVAEKSFLRRQIALAQAVIGRAHQLTLRVTRILDPKRPLKNRGWKPAVPLVVLAAAACGFSASWTPALVTIQDGAAQGRPLVSANLNVVQANGMTAGQVSEGLGVKAWPTSMKVERNFERPHAKQAYERPPANVRPQARATIAPRTAAPRARVTMAKLSVIHNGESAMSRQRQTPSPMVMAKHQIGTPAKGAQTTIKAVDAGDGLLMLVATQQTITAGPNGWRIEVSQVRWVVPAKAFLKPAPSKT